MLAAGAVLSDTIAPDEYEGAASAFATAHAWRAAHLTPMHSMRLSIYGVARAVTGEALVAGRIKRMSSIRKKLRRTSISLWEIQDIAGVRAIVPGMQDVDAITARLMSGELKHRLARTDDRIATPKASGYRSRHHLMRFRGEGELAALNRRSVELQLRTVLQHSWATALEAVGLMRGEDLKAGYGSEEWLRLFRLMAAQFADDENLPGVPGEPTDRTERLKQIRLLDGYLDALAILDGYKHAIRRVETRGPSAGGRFVVAFDRNAQTVHVYPSTSVAAFLGGARSNDPNGVESVVVEVDRVDSLAAAYPNYFADVTVFATRLRSYLTGRDGTRKHPLSWLRDYHWRRA